MKIKQFQLKKTIIWVTFSVFLMHTTSPLLATELLPFDEHYDIFPVEEETLPAEEEVTPPTEEETLPPAEEEITPPTEEETTPPTEEEETTPPTEEEEMTPPTEEEEMTPPTEEETLSIEEEMIETFDVTATPATCFTTTDSAGNITITDYLVGNEGCTTAVVIPSVIGGKPVTSI